MELSIPVDFHALIEALESQLCSKDAAILINWIYSRLSTEQLKALDRKIAKRLGQPNLTVEPMPTPQYKIEIECLSKLAAFLRDKKYNSLSIRHDGSVTFH